MLKILITGGKGNIASMIYNNLKSKYDIVCATRQELDLLDFNNVKEYLENNRFDVCIHTAITGGRRTKPEDGEVTHNNLVMFENLIAFSHKFKMIINMDSGAIYDRAGDILNRGEDDLYTVPKDYYGFSKYVIYNRSLMFENIFHFRIFNIFHKKEEPDRFISMCFNAKKENKQITIYDNKYFDFMYETDFVKIVDYYLESVFYGRIAKLYKTVNVGYREKYTLYGIAYQIIGDDSLIQVENINSTHNYSGNVDRLYDYDISFEGLIQGLELYNS